MADQGVRRAGRRSGPAAAARGAGPGALLSAAPRRRGDPGRGRGAGRGPGGRHPAGAARRAGRDSRARGRGVPHLGAGDARHRRRGGALPYLRKAHQQWGRIGAPYEVARTRVLVGRAVAALGDLESARRELTAAAESLAALGAAPEADEAARLGSPGRLPGGLTAREVEVLRLVAAGRSNAQIAAELVLSDKTVARHLSNIFGKLEVGSRTAAAAFAFAHGLA
ncbi:MAG: helix-turn-helix transcriptional regulator [Nocardioides sp.]